MNIALILNNLDCATEFELMVSLNMLRNIRRNKALYRRLAKYPLMHLAIPQFIYWRGLIFALFGWQEAD